MKISFIIPAYNASNTIVRCLNSIVSVPFQSSEYEIIVIDDCSKDNTVSVLTEYKKSHTNLHIISQPENHRQGAARNLGLLIAKGDYVVFVDSDDEVDKGILSAVVLAEKNNLQMVAFRVEKLSPDKMVPSTITLPYESEVFSGMELQTEHPFWCTAPWGYIYDRSFLEEVNYPFAEDVLYEDSDFVNVHLYHAKRMGYSDQCAYIFHENPSSVTHNITFRNLADYVLLGTRMLEFYRFIGDKSSQFASSILEGGSYNIMKSCKYLFKLKSRLDVRAFYDRIDSYVDRRTLLQYREPAYCWTKWTRFCLKHRTITTFFVGLILSAKLVTPLKAIIN